MKRQPEPELMDIDTEAEAYAVADFDDVNEVFVARLLDVVGPRECALAVDLGTGPGDIPLRVLRQRPKWQVVAGDAAFPMLRFGREAEKRGRRCSVLWLQADAKVLPLREDCFDVVFSNSILHHITDVAPFWAGVKRVAKPGAILFLRDLFRPETPEAARSIVDKYAAEESDLLQEEFYRSLLSAYTPDEIRAQLARAGLSGLEVGPVTDRHLDIFGRLV